MCNLWPILDLINRVEALHRGLDSAWIVGILHPDSVNHPPIAVPPRGKLDEFNRSLCVGERYDPPIRNPLVEVPGDRDLLPFAPRPPEKYSFGRLHRLDSQGTFLDRRELFGNHFIREMLEVLCADGSRRMRDDRLSAGRRLAEPDRLPDDRLIARFQLRFEVAQELVGKQCP